MEDRFQSLAATNFPEAAMKVTSNVLMQRVPFWGCGIRTWRSLLLAKRHMFDWLARASVTGSHSDVHFKQKTKVSTIIGNSAEAVSVLVPFSFNSVCCCVRNSTFACHEQNITNVERITQDSLVIFEPSAGKPSGKWLPLTNIWGNFLQFSSHYFSYSCLLAGSKRVNTPSHEINGMSRGCVSDKTPMHVKTYCICVEYLHPNINFSYLAPRK